MLCTRCHSPLAADLNLLFDGATCQNLSHSENVMDLEAEMALLEGMMEGLARRRTALRSKINSLSPTARLPQELLTEIFRICCQPSDDRERTIAPLFFGGISKDWRSIAWSTPLLWNSVSLHVSRTAHGSQVHLLGDWLLRAQTSPLFIKLTSDDEHESIFCSLRAIMDVLVTRSTYWHSLDCILPPQCHDILKNNHFPTLTSVSVRPPKGTISTFSEPPNMFLSAPKLLDVDLSGYNFPAMVLPWEQLRRFKTQFLTVAECLKILRRSPNLRECHLDSVYSPEIIPSASADTLYSQLERLDVSLIKRAATSLLDSITLPSLAELHVHYNGLDSILSSISLLVLRSSCSLQHLSIENQNLRDDDLIPCLEAIPSLVHLRLVVLGDSIPPVGLTDRLVSELNPSYHSGQPLLPKLVSFEYRGRIFCEDGPLVDMLRNRTILDRKQSAEEVVDPNNSVSQLKKVDIVSTARYEITEDMRIEFSKLSDAGIMLSVRSLDESAGSYHYTTSDVLSYNLPHHRQSPCSDDVSTLKISRNGGSEVLVWEDQRIYVACPGTSIQCLSRV